MGQRDDIRQEVHDPLEEVNLGTAENPSCTYISKELPEEKKLSIIKILQTYKDCFAWEHHKMPGIDPSIIQHESPIKPGCTLVVQSPRRLAPDLIPKIKEEITNLLKAGFILPVKYAE